MPSARCLVVHTEFLLPEQTQSILCMCLVLDPMAWKQNPFHHPWHDLVDMYLPLHTSETSLVESDDFDESLLGPGCSSLASEGVVRGSTGLSGGRTS